MKRIWGWDGEKASLHVPVFSRLTLFFPGSSAGKESVCKAGDPSSIPGLGKSPGEGNDYSLQYSSLENSMDYIVHVGRSSSLTVWIWLRTFKSDVMAFPCGSAGKESVCNAEDLGLIPGSGRSPGEGIGYPLWYSGLENSMDCIVHGVYTPPYSPRVGHDWATFTFTVFFSFQIPTLSQFQRLSSNLQYKSSF